MATVGSKAGPLLLGGRAVIFVTVGSMFPFDRMVRLMDNWTAQHRAEEVVAQIGGGTYEPKHMTWERMIAPNAYKRLIRSCRLMVAHAGTGSVFTAAEFGVPIVLVPRRAAYKEHTTDHQIDTAKWLEGKSGIFVAWTDNDLAAAIELASGAQLTGQPLVSPSASPPFIERIREFVLTA